MGSDRVGSVWYETTTPIKSYISVFCESLSRFAPADQLLQTIEFSPKIAKPANTYAYTYGRAKEDQGGLFPQKFMLHSSVAIAREN